MKLKNLMVAAAAATSLSCVASQAGAQPILEPGFYPLMNHPQAIPRPFGLRLDELYNVATFQDIFLFDFDHPMSLMIMEVTPTTLHIFGDAWGGRWFQTDFLNDQYLGLYTIDFLFNVGVQQAPGDDDIIVNAPNNINHGTIMTPLGDTIDLWDERGTDPYSFRVGDEDHDFGHRGWQGVSGWGWLNHGPDPAIHRPVGDWLFTVGPLIPAPGAATLLLAGCAALALRRRR